MFFKLLCGLKQITQDLRDRIIYSHKHHQIKAIKYVNHNLMPATHVTKNRYDWTVQFKLHSYRSAHTRY